MVNSKIIIRPYEMNDSEDMVSKLQVGYLRVGCGMCGENGGVGADLYWIELVYCAVPFLVATSLALFPPICSFWSF